MSRLRREAGEGRREAQRGEEERQRLREEVQRLQEEINVAASSKVWGAPLTRAPARAHTDTHARTRQSSHVMLDKREHRQ